MATNYHEPHEQLDELQRQSVRALNSLKQQIQAVDWYQQRIATTDDQELKQILIHHRDQQIQHAIMIIQWLRINRQPWADYLQQYLYAQKVKQQYKLSNLIKQRRLQKQQIDQLDLQHQLIRDVQNIVQRLATVDDAAIDLNIIGYFFNADGANKKVVSGKYVFVQDPRYFQDYQYYYDVSQKKFYIQKY